MLSDNWFGKNSLWSRRSQPKQRLAKGKRRKSTPQQQGRSLRMEELEDRRLLAVYAVSNLLDLVSVDDTLVAAPGSLRQAVELSNASENVNDYIVFEDFLFPQQKVSGSASETIFLSGGDEGGALVITDEVQILGPGSSSLRIQATGNFRVFETNIGAEDEVLPVTIGGLTIYGGTLIGTDEDANRGAGIYNREGLTLVETVVRNNNASQGGGGIFMPVGSLNLVRSLVTGNSGGGGGGGILLYAADEDNRPSATINNSTIAGNSAFGQPERPGFGGGVFNRDGRVTILNSTITANSASAGGAGVATYGVADPDDEAPIVTSLSHSILYGNTGDDVMAVRTNFDGDPIAPTLNLDLNGGYNFVGQIGTASLRGNPNDLEDMDNPPPLDSRRFNFYEVVSAADGIDWTTANQFTTHGNGSGHLASISGNVPDPDLGSYSPVAEFVAENDFVFSLIDSGQYWKEFVPTEPGDPLMPPPPQNIGPWIGGIQVDTSMGAGGGWEWVTTVPGEEPPPPFPVDPFDNVAWAAGQPDDALQITEPTDPPTMPPLEEDRLAFFTPDSPTRAATWGDLPAEPDAAQLPIAYIIEYEQGNNFFGLNPLLESRDDYGGTTEVYYPGIGSPAIDAGDTSIMPDTFVYEQRGRHFRRVADGGSGNGEIIDIGAVEVQQGQFRVDTLADEADRQYSGVWETEPCFGSAYSCIVGYGDTTVTLNNPVYNGNGFHGLGSLGGDFSLREALEFSEKNPGVDTITFEPISAAWGSQILLDLDDPTLSSAAPTILLGLTTLSDSGTGTIVDPNSALTILSSVNIVGPTGFEIEIDASGNDPTPGSNDADGTRIFKISNDNLFTTSDVRLANLTLLGGDAVDSGGAIRNSENLIITNSTIKENAASTDGGGVFSQYGDLVIESSTLNDNHAANSGGALFVDTGLPGSPATAVVRNSTISGNIASVRGGGIYNYNGEVLVEFSTITANNAGSFQTSGIGSANGAGATLTQVRSSIVSANLGGDVDFIFGSTTIQSLGFNLIGTGTASLVFNQPGDTIGVTNPQLAPLLNTGGRNATHRLLPNSPAIDKGDSVAVAGVTGVPEFDERGSLFTRVFDGVQDTKDRIDIGAYELQPTVFIVDSLFDENDGDISTDNFSLREAIEAANLNPLTDTIIFSPNLLGGEIIQNAKNSGALQPFTTTDIQITDSVNIIGLGKSFLTLSGGAATDANIADGKVSRFFTIDDGSAANDIEVKITDLRLRQSNNVTDVGASIMSHESLTLERVSLIDNSTLGSGFSGGAIYQRYGDLTLDRVTISANTTDGVNADGGGVFVRDADLTVMNNTTISGNTTTQTLGSGGGIYIRNGALTMSNSSVTSNLAPGGEADGGGIFARQAVLDITNSVISFNSMTGSNSEGAGIFAQESELSLVDSVIGLNSTVGTQSEGAGLYLSNSTTAIERTTISSNQTSGHQATGAGIALIGGSLAISDSTLAANNTSGQDASGGAIHNLAGQLTIVDSLITGNSVSGANSKGGGVFSFTTLTGPSATVLNSTISGNSSAVAGGGLYNRWGLLTIRHSTITDNDGPTFGFGSGVGSNGTLNSTRTDVYSSIIAGNGTSDVDRVGGTFANTFQSLGYNLIGTGLSISEFTESGDLNGVADPLLNTLGPKGTHSPLEASPAVNAGDPNAVPGSNGVPLYDQRGTGFARVLGGTMDIGAHESTFVPFIPTDFDSDGDTDGSDFLAWQRGFGKSNASQSDGDSDGDSDVDGVDLTNWMSNFGTGAPAALVAASSAQDIFASPEPLLAAPVLVVSPLSSLEESEEVEAGAASQLLAGRILLLSSGVKTATPALIEVETTVEEGRDVLFADFKTLAVSGDYEDIASEQFETEEIEEDELEFSLEDQVFALLGS